MKLSAKEINIKLNELRTLTPDFFWSVNQGRNTVIKLTGHITPDLNLDFKGLYEIKLTFKGGKWNTELENFTKGMDILKYKKAKEAKDYDRIMAS